MKWHLKFKVSIKLTFKLKKKNKSFLIYKQNIMNFVIGLGLNFFLKSFSNRRLKKKK